MWTSNAQLHPCATFEFFGRVAEAIGLAASVCVRELLARSVVGEASVFDHAQDVSRAGDQVDAPTMLSFAFLSIACSSCPTSSVNSTVAVGEEALQQSGGLDEVSPWNGPHLVPHELERQQCGRHFGTSFHIAKLSAIICVSSSRSQPEVHHQGRLRRHREHLAPFFSLNLEVHTRNVVLATRSTWRSRGLSRWVSWWWSGETVTLLVRQSWSGETSRNPRCLLVVPCVGRISQP